MDKPKEKKVIELQSTVTPEAVGKEGLIKRGDSYVRDDAWLHADMTDEAQEKRTNRYINSMYRTIKSSEQDIDKSFDLYLDLSKAQPPEQPKTGRRLDRTKLVRRPVQVRGKDGKMYTRMQWVDPHAGDPTPAQPTAQKPVQKPSKPKLRLEEEPKPQDKQPKEETKEPKEVKEQPEPKFSPKKKDYDESSKEGYIDKQIDAMSRDEKFFLLRKYKINWEAHANPQRENMNAVNALKQYMYQHPELLNAGHLPSSGGAKRNADGTEAIQHYLNTLGREGSFKLMAELGIGDGVDPEGTPMADLKYAKAMMILKKYLQENPHIMDEHKPTVPGAQKDPDVRPTKAQKGGNNIKGVLDSMSRSQQYDLMAKLGIASIDPLKDPAFAGKESLAAMKHMRNMMELKKRIELDPSLIGMDSQEEFERTEELSDDDKLSKDITQALGRLKFESDAYVKKYEKHKDFPKRIRSDNPHIDHMHAVSALKKFYLLHPELFDKDRLSMRHVGNKEMIRFLRDYMGFEGVGDVTQNEKGVEYKFGAKSDYASFARILGESDGYDEPILSVVDTGEFGDEWNEHEVPLREVFDFLDGKIAPKPKAKVVPLHERPIDEVEKALSADFDKNYTPEVGRLMKNHLKAMWAASGKSDMFADWVHLGNGITSEAIAKLLDKYGVHLNYNSSGPNMDHVSWKKFAHGDLVTSTKTKHARDYLFNDGAGVDTWALHESARQWSPEERKTARFELLGDALEWQSYRDPDFKDRAVQHLTDTLEFAPFDLLTDMLAGGLEFSFLGSWYGNKFLNGGHHIGTKGSCGSIAINEAYLSEIMASDSNSWGLHTEIRHNGETYKYNSLGFVIAHEFGHALDHFLGGYEGISGKWDSDNAKKYVGRFGEALRSSYTRAVNASDNPGMMMKHPSYGFFHKAEWVSAYEGRVYGQTTYDIEHPDYVEHVQGATWMDKKWPKKNQQRGRPTSNTSYNHPSPLLGTEHFADNVGRLAGALHFYRDNRFWGAETRPTISQWSESSAQEFQSYKYGTFAEIMKDPMLNDHYEGVRDYPSEGYGFLYQRSKSAHPGLYKCLEYLLDRPDFIEERNSKPSVSQAYEKGDYARKSDLIVFLK